MAESPVSCLPSHTRNPSRWVGPKVAQKWQENYHSKASFIFRCVCCIHQSNSIDYLSTHIKMMNTLWTSLLFITFFSLLPVDATRSVDLMHDVNPYSAFSSSNDLAENFLSFIDSTWMKHRTVKKISRRTTTSTTTTYSSISTRKTPFTQDPSPVVAFVTTSKSSSWWLTDLFTTYKCNIITFRSFNVWHSIQTSFSGLHIVCLPTHAIQKVIWDEFGILWHCYPEYQEISSREYVFISVTMGSLQILSLPFFFSGHVTQRLPNFPLQYRGNADHERHRLSLFYIDGESEPLKNTRSATHVKLLANAFHSAIVLHSKYIVSLWQRSKCFDIKSNVVGI